MNCCWYTTLHDLAAINPLTCASYMSSTLVTAISLGQIVEDPSQLHVINYFYEDGIQGDFCQHYLPQWVKLRILTHWGRDKMAAIFRTAFSNTFSSMKMHQFRLILKFVPNSQINNITALVQIMVCHQPGGKPLSEPGMVRLPKHIYIIQP